jgi:hypothetical protein
VGKGGKGSNLKGNIENKDHHGVTLFMIKNFASLSIIVEREPFVSITFPHYSTSFLFFPLNLLKQINFFQAY